MRIDDITIEEKEVHVDIKTNKKFLTFTFEINKEKKILILHKSPITSGYKVKKLTASPEIVQEAREIVKEAILKKNQFEDYKVIE